VPRKTPGPALVGMFLVGAFFVTLTACPHCPWLGKMICGLVGAVLMLSIAAHVVGLVNVRAVLRDLLPLWRAIVALLRRLGPSGRG
jgi:hypothetical protein